MPNFWKAAAVFFGVGDFRETDFILSISLRFQKYQVISTQDFQFKKNPNKQHFIRSSGVIVIQLFEDPYFLRHKCMTQKWEEKDM